MPSFNNFSKYQLVEFDGTFFICGSEVDDLEAGVPQENWVDDGYASVSFIVDDPRVAVAVIDVQVQDLQLQFKLLRTLWLYALSTTPLGPCVLDKLIQISYTNDLSYLSSQKE